MSDGLQLAARGLTYSAAGWAMESAWRGEPAKSVMLDDIPLPVLPVYGIGGLIAVGLHETVLADKPWYVRALAYAGSLSALEWVSCQLGREVYGHVNWSYDGDACVDLPHAAAWGALGLLLERVDPIMFGSG